MQNAAERLGGAMGDRAVDVSLPSCFELRLGQDCHRPSTPELELVVGKVFQECQNGLLSSVEVIPAPANPLRAFDRVVAFAESLGADFVRRPNGVDLCIPRACLTLLRMG
jgi:hypothetical protein